MKISKGVYRCLEDGRGVGSDLGEELSALLDDGSCDGGAFGLSLVVNDDTRVVFAVDKGAVGSPPWLSLTDDDCLEELLSQVGLSLSNRDEDDIADRGSGESVEDSVVGVHRNNVEHLGAAVVGAGELASNGDGDGNSMLDSLSSSSRFLWHYSLYITDRLF